MFTTGPVTETTIFAT